MCRSGAAWLAVISFCLVGSGGVAFATPVVDRPADAPAFVAPSIYNISPLRDGLITGFSLGIVAWAYTDGEKLIHPRCPCDLGELNSLDRSVVGRQNPAMNHLSDISLGLIFALPVVFDYWELGLSKSFYEDMAVYIETLSVNGGLVAIVKYSVQRPLPRTYDGDPLLVNAPGGYRSFYSGHTANAFAALTTAAMTLKLRHPDTGWWPWAVTGILGTSVALEKISDGQHFYTDVIVGAAVGTALGIAVPLLHKKSLASADAVDLALLPFEDGAVARVGFGF